MPPAEGVSAFAQAARRSESTEEDTAGPLRSTSIERWHSAARQISTANAVSRSFKTLRDMSGESYIEDTRLKKIKELGSGSFATVQLCQLQPVGDEQAVHVAVKRIHAHVMKQGRDLEAFVSEAKLLRKLQHRYIVRFIGVGGDSDLTTLGQRRGSGSFKGPDAHTFIVQEYIDGGSLGRQVLQKMCGQKSYTSAEALTWMRQIAEALCYLHDAKPCVIHRDLKLENVFMRKLPDGKLQATLGDFGLSALVKSTKIGPEQRQLLGEATKGEGDETWRKLSRALDKSMKSANDLSFQRSHPEYAQVGHDLTGRTGSFLYMAPEVVFALPYNEKVDVFAFACIMLEVFSFVITSAVVVGPTQNPKAAEMYAFKVAEGYRRPLPQNMPVPLADLIQACWADKPGDRPAMSQCVERLRTMEASDIFADQAIADSSKQGCSCKIM